MGPKVPSRASRYHKPAFAKALKIFVFSMFLASRAIQDSPKRAQESPKRAQESPKGGVGSLSWARLGWVWACLWGRLGMSRGHLGMVLGQSWTISRSILESNIGSCWNRCWGHFLDWFLAAFRTTCGAILGSFWGPDRPKRDREGAKETIQSFKVQKTCHRKDLGKP